MIQKDYAISVDIGGTWVRTALISQEGTLLGKVKEKVDITNNLAIGRQIARMSREIMKQQTFDFKSIKGVGIASTGPLDVKTGALIKPTNLPFGFVPLTSVVEEELGVKALLVNDCTAAVVGEKWFGAGKKTANLFYVTLSTGIGGGAIVDDNLLMGKDGNAAEIGHFTIDYNGRLVCGCGRRGHWEAYCSGKNIPNYVRMRLKDVDRSSARGSSLYDKAKNITSEKFFWAAKNKDKLAVQLLREIGQLNAMGFANIINAFDPELICVGGTVALKNTDLVLQPIRKNVDKYALNRVPEIILTPLGEEIGVYGAAAAVFRSNDS